MARMKFNNVELSLRSMALQVDSDSAREISVPVASPSKHRRSYGDAQAMRPGSHIANLHERKMQPELIRSDHSASILATIHLHHEYDDLDGRTCPLPHIPLLRLIPSTQSTIEKLNV